MPLRYWTVAVVESGTYWSDQLSARFGADPVYVLPLVWPALEGTEARSVPTTLRFVLLTPPETATAEELLTTAAAWRAAHWHARLCVLLNRRHARFVAPLRELLINRVLLGPVPPPRLERSMRRFMEAADRRLGGRWPVWTDLSEGEPDKWLPRLDDARCSACGWCVQLCPTECLALRGLLPALVRPDRCVRCGLCVEFCPTGALAQRETGGSGPETAGDVAP